MNTENGKNSGGGDESAHEPEVRWIPDLLLVTLLAWGVLVLLVVGTMTQATWLVDLESLMVRFWV